jgi:hypothetical protein
MENVNLSSRCTTGSLSGIYSDIAGPASVIAWRTEGILERGGGGDKA